MSQPEKNVRDLMIPISEYAVVPENATLLEALLALKQFQPTDPNGGHRHRAVLVRGRNGRIIGKVGHFSFLHAVRHTHEQLAADPRLGAAGVDEEMMQVSDRAYRLFNQDLCGLCEQSKLIRVNQAMHPVTERIDVSASLLDAVDAFDRWQTLSLLVTQYDRGVGILRLVDLFDEVASIMIQCSEKRGC